MKVEMVLVDAARQFPAFSKSSNFGRFASHELMNARNQTLMNSFQMKSSSSNHNIFTKPLQVFVS